MTQGGTVNRIRPLSQAVADRIAAGEVVERPASVVKELVENALDAGARRISVVVEDAGRTLIRVTDDGTGMTAEELTAALGRHATSKITRFEDLERLSTFGFRGEALPSIAAVSRMELTSRPVGAEVGTTVQVEGGKVVKAEPVGCPEGTTVAVGHLFYNVPARRKFLRSDATEFKWIATVFRNFALAFPEVAWELYRDGEVVYQLGAGSPRERLAGLLGDDAGREMLEVDSQRGWLKVRGWVSPPSLVQRSSVDQYLFINRRPIVNLRLNRAVYNACEPYLVGGGHPLYVLFLEAEPSRFDINVHPAKKEVKFADEGGAFAAVFGAVRDAVAGSRAPVELKGTEATPKRSQVAAVEGPAHLQAVVPTPRRHLEPRGPVMPFPAGSTPRVAAGGGETAPTPGELLYPPGEGPNIWQVFNTYLVSPLTTGLVFIDQHIAHERILYERALSAMEREPMASQQLLFPVTLELRYEDVGVVEEVLPLLRALGFEMYASGPRQYRIAAVPAGLRVSNERELVLGMVEEFRDTGSTGRDPRQRLAAAFACRSAVKAGQPLEPEEMRRLVDELFQTEDPEFCPHGRPIFHVLSLREIEKWFKR